MNFGNLLFGDPLVTGAAANRDETQPGIGLDGARIVDMDGQIGARRTGSLHAPQRLDHQG